MSEMNDWNAKMIAEFREGNGTAGRFGRGLIIMHTVGAKSGDERLAPVAALPHDGGWLVCASKAGAPTHPGWYYNLVANPRFEIEAALPEDGIETVPIVARELTDDAEYDAAWATFTASYPGFIEYTKTTEGRRMPLFQLARA